MDSVPFSCLLLPPAQLRRRRAQGARRNWKQMASAPDYPRRGPESLPGVEGREGWDRKSPGSPLPRGTTEHLPFFWLLQEPRAFG